MFTRRLLQICAVLLPPTAAAGALLGGQLMLFRIVALVVIVVGAWRGVTQRDRSVVQVAALALTGLVLLSASITWFWPGWPASGVVELVSLVVGLLLAASVAGQVELWRYLAWGVVLTLLGEAVVVAWEQTSGLHLPSFALTWEDDRYMGMWFQMAGTFANPNQLGHLAALSFPIAVWVAAAERQWWLRLPAVVAALVCPWLVIASGSRVSLVALILAVAITVAALPKGWLVLAAGAVAAVATLVLRPDLIAGFIPADKEALSDQDPRLNLAINGWWMLQQTWGLGVGPGGFGQWANRLESPREPYGLTNPHNAMVEIAAQYGLIVAAGFLLASVTVLWWAVRAWREAATTADRIFAATVVAGVGLWPLLGMANSQWMPLSWSVLELALLAAAAWRLTPERLTSPAAASG